jgi:membrane-associated phospholipid phosphatase
MSITLWLNEWVKKLRWTLANVLSRLLDPTWEIPAALVVAVAFAVREGLRWRFMGLLLFIDAIVPMIFFLTMLHHKQISDWDIQKRTQRIPLYLFTLACHLGGLWLAHELGKTSLVSVLLVYYVVAIIFFGITWFWKISLHAGVNAVLVTTLNIFTNWKYWWLYGLVVAVCWARVYQKHHTWTQVVVGAILGGIIVGVGLSLAGIGYFWWKD